MKSFVLSVFLFLACSCQLVEGQPDGGLRSQLIEMATAIGDAAFRLEGTRLLREHAPELVPLMDKVSVGADGQPLPADGMVSLAEFVSFVRNVDPATIVVLGAIYFRE